MTEELDSQLSAMFDDELPHGECELMARRLARDEGLRQRWGRYAAMRACFREEGSARSVHIAARVRSGLSGEPGFAGSAAPRGRMPQRIAGNLWRTAAAAAVACSVAALSIVWVRSQSMTAGNAGKLGGPLAAVAAPASTTTPTQAPSTVTVASAAASPATRALVSSEPDSYVTPAAADIPAFVPTTELANYVVAHSEYSMPINRSSLLSSFVGGEPPPSASSEPNAPADPGEPRAGSDSPR